uniref:Uncharacterized protein n=1 Tax=uncultured nuHF1 cluster bacterium HF0770_35I22 TaxID=723586 RepID=E7C7M3_9BACT|nr:hypothetical protein [uncultured nuHF1 cluster bacterium HF0770_35I22]
MKIFLVRWVFLSVLINLRTRASSQNQQKSKHIQNYNATKTAKRQKLLILTAVVGLGRLELPTSRLSGVCSNQLSYRPYSREPANRQQILTANHGGAGRDRTDDLKLAKLPLSQLSYGPVKSIFQRLTPDRGRFLTKG